MSFTGRAADLMRSGTAWAGLSGDALAYVLASVAEQGRWLIVVDEPDQAERLVSGLSFFHPHPRRIIRLPADDGRAYDGYSPDPDVVQRRLRTLHRVDSGKDVVVVAEAAALVRRVPTRAVRRAGTRVVNIGDTLDRDDLVRELVSTGYLTSGRVAGPGSFAVRGDVVDVWGAGLSHPVRLDFWDDEIELIQRFDPATHRATKRVQRAVLLPAREERIDSDALSHAKLWLNTQLAEQGRGVALRRRVLEDLEAGLRFSAIEDWLPALVDTDAPLDALDGLQRVIVHPAEVAAALRETERGAAGRFAGLSEDERPLVLPTDRMVRADVVIEQLSTAQHVHEFAGAKDAVDLGTRSADAFAVKGAELGPVVERIKQLVYDDIAVGIVADTATRAERLQEMLGNHGLHVNYTSDPMSLPNGKASLLIGPLRKGFVARDSRVAYITSATLFGGGRRAAQARNHIHQFFDAAVQNVSQLRAGDHVVHKLHGIGQYHGLARLDVGGVDQDFVRLEYRGGDVLYLPVTVLSDLSRYSPSKAGAKVQLDKLGGTTFSRRQQRVKDSVLKMATELLSVYAKRELAAREPYPKAGDLYQTFVARFPHDETPDQADAIVAVHEDLSDDSPMDRLICGDVGFGKTEVAMRAAMRVVESGRQVAILCPTTVLAHQHWQRFCERFEGLPVHVEMLSRFRTTAQDKQIKADLKSGKINIIVGTMRLLGREVRFDDLGLLVIDEEHRFGVKQKDKLKKMRAGIDVLSMSATPIPRTLEMALSGLREMSLIATPPTDRLAVRTSVARSTETRIRDAIQTELERKGQVYFLHNRVETIERVTERIRRWVPEARVDFAHGQMTSDELENALVRFINHDVDVLVCTAIVESGVDLPNVNTMIVDRADRFGLAQLHQLRGRVGRASSRGHCLLLTPELMTPEARKRLRILVENSGLGAGFRIASEDLELRGGGNLLGDSQSGNIDAVGYDMWVELLADAVRVARGDLDRAHIDPDVDIPVAAFIPEDLVKDVDERMGWYSKFAQATSANGIDSLLDDFEGWFGEPPPEVRNVAGLAQVRILCRELGIQRCSWLKVRVILQMHASTSLTEEQMDAFQRKHPKRVTLKRVEGSPTQLSVRFLQAEAQRPFQFLRWLFADLTRTS